MNSIKQGMFATAAFLLAFLFLFIVSDGHATLATTLERPLPRLAIATQTAHAGLVEVLAQEEMNTLQQDFRLTLQELRTEIPKMIATLKSLQQRASAKSLTTPSH